MVNEKMGLSNTYYLSLITFNLPAYYKPTGSRSDIDSRNH